MFAPTSNEYRPVQLYHLSTDGVSCDTAPPDKALSDWVYFHWLLRIDIEHAELEVIPDNALDLVLSPSIQDFAALYFPVDAPFVIPLEGPVLYGGTSLKAEHTAKLFGYDLALLKSLEPGLETVKALGLEALVDSVQGVDTLSGLRTIMDDFVGGLTPRSYPPAHSGPLELMLSHLEPAGLTTVAASMGISERTFRRLSSDLLGLSPKKIQRVLRLQRALHELFSPLQPEQREGFYDDSHLIHELKALTGLTPGQLRRLAENYNTDHG